MFQIIAYFKFLLKSTNEHGVHSPFVFDLITKCFYNKKKLPVYATLDKYRKYLLDNKDTIEVTDFGAGSRIFKSNTRKIADIAKNAGISKKRAQLLLRLITYFKPNTALELGTSLGLATTAMALGCSNTKITSVEGCPKTYEFAKKQFEQNNLKNISPINANFDSFFKKNKENFDFVYFDGNHQKKATLQYFYTLVEQVHNDTVFIFDDIHWSKDMEEAWEDIKKHQQVKITIDTFYWGFAFFRNETKHKEHFIIRA